MHADILRTVLRSDGDEHTFDLPGRGDRRDDPADLGPQRGDAFRSDTTQAVLLVLAQNVLPKPLSEKRDDTAAVDLGIVPQEGADIPAGMTFSRYLNVVRVDRAIGLMSARPDVTMTELMGSCGFNTLRNFNRVFKDITGYAPTALPDGFVLNYRSLATEDNSFDPTLAVSEVLAGTEGEHGSPG